MINKISELAKNNKSVLEALRIENGTYQQCIRRLNLRKC